MSATFNQSSALVALVTWILFLSNLQAEGTNNLAGSAASAASSFVQDSNVLPGSDVADHDDGSNGYDATFINHLARMKREVELRSRVEANAFDPVDLDEFMNNPGGLLSAENFLLQRPGNWRRAARMAISTLKWRNSLALAHLNAGYFPCDLFELGLIFEYGHSHYQNAQGAYVEGSPVIWVRIGAIGRIVKHLERPTLHRVSSLTYHSSRGGLSKIRKLAQKRHRHPRIRAAPKERRQPVRSMSVKDNETVMHVLRAIAWWINNWVHTHPEGPLAARATLVLDFEHSDFAFASWTIGEFFLNLDNHFPGVFDQIIGFRYKPKLWYSLENPISMFNRIFKSRVQSSRETDRKVKFVATEPQISAYMPRVDANGTTMLPEHVSGTCVAPDNSKAPAGCQRDPTAGGLYDPAFWQTIHNEFYYACEAKPRT